MGSKSFKTKEPTPRVRMAPIATEGKEATHLTGDLLHCRTEYIILKRVFSPGCPAYTAGKLPLLKSSVCGPAIKVGAQEDACSTWWGYRQSPAHNRSRLPTHMSCRNAQVPSAYAFPQGGLHRAKLALELKDALLLHSTTVIFPGWGTTRQELLEVGDQDALGSQDIFRLIHRLGMPPLSHPCHSAMSAVLSRATR